MDSHGRPFRLGTVGVAIGVSGLPALLDLRGRTDLFGRELRISMQGYADMIASAAQLTGGEAAEGRPVILLRGLQHPPQDGQRQRFVAPARPRSLSLSDGYMSASPPGPADPVLAALHTRRSLRRYHPQLPSQALLEQVLNAAIQAPSAHNRQPWRFVVLRDAEQKAGLARAMGAQLRA